MYYPGHVTLWANCLPNKTVSFSLTGMWQTDMNNFHIVFAWVRFLQDQQAYLHKTLWAEGPCCHGYNEPTCSNASIYEQNISVNLSQITHTDSETELDSSQGAPS